jgi:2-polyprenyl-3-methyl-5-hydroxy-6-metoxy-1,4-benzoquinol methylase
MSSSSLSSSISSTSSKRNLITQYRRIQTCKSAMDSLVHRNLRHHGCSYQEVSKVMSSECSDDGILDRLHTLIESKKKKGVRNVKNKDEIRGASKANTILQLVECGAYKAFTSYRPASTARYLDVGAANGVITKKVGAKLGFDPKNVHGVDIPEWLEHDHEEESKANSQDGLATIVYLPRKKKDDPEEQLRLPYDTASFDLVTCLMSIHHFENKPLMMHEVSRVMKPKALLVIREHNCETDFEDFLIKFEHAVYVIAIDGNSAKDFWSSFICSLESAEQLRRDLETWYGFRRLHYDPEDRAANKAYWAVFEKL